MKKSTKQDSRLTGETSRRILRRDPNPHLFRPISFRSVTAKNRIMLSPMCQYSATDGIANDWHFAHLAARASGGAGIVFTEAVHTEAAGRITPNCLGLWNDEQQDAFSRISEFIIAQGAVAGIQLGHAGRKASVGRPWEGSSPIPVDQGGWNTVAPSARAYSDDWREPVALTKAEIGKQFDWATSIPSRVAVAELNVLNPSIGRVRHFLDRIMSPSAIPSKPDLH